MSQIPADSNAIHGALATVAGIARVRPICSMRQFAEQEIILPTGPYQGERFKTSTQPFGVLWLDAVDSGAWRRHCLTGAVQGGKTLFGSAVPVMYHLFEHRETIIYAAPTLDMAADKWRQDIFPLIQASRYRDLLPSSGSGSKGGTPAAITFRHGPTLKFMTGGGNDKVRAGFTARVAIITETDGFDEAGGSSRETDKFSQIESRTNAYKRYGRQRIYMECTVSTDTGRTWQELKQGTDSRLSLPCPHCHQWVTPEREHLHGWHEARTEIEAGEGAFIACPACGCAWTEEDRTAANQQSRLVHRGQKIESDGTIVGMVPQTNTFSLRFTAANNLFITMGQAAQEEWLASRKGDAALAEKKICQFTWATPSENESITLTEMDAMAIANRAVDIPRGRVPAGTKYLTVGIDIGKWLCHWTAIAWSHDGTPHIVEYGKLKVASAVMAEEKAIDAALRKFRDEQLAVGWPSVVAGTPNFRPNLSILDAGNQWSDVVTLFCRDKGSGPAYLPGKGFGTTQVSTARRKMQDPGYEAVDPNKDGGYLLEINADVWKSYAHARLQTPVGQPGGFTLFHALPSEHLEFAKHLTAEKQVEDFVTGSGTVTRWVAMSRANHWLDACSMASVAGHAAGVRLVSAIPQSAPPRCQTQVRRISYVNPFLES